MRDTKQDNQSVPSDSPQLNSLYDKIRIFLVGWMALLTIIVFLTYLVTRDIGVLLGTTIVGIAVSSVFAYFFRRP
jgi:hypothetical protein